MDRRSATLSSGAIALFLLFLSACGGTHTRTVVSSPPQAAPLSTAPAVLQLRRDIDSILSAPALDRGIWGVVIRSASQDEVLYSMNARKLLMPASNMKIVTLSAAAELLGWDYTFETRLVATGPIDAGVLRGDLVVIGGGDPSIDDWDAAATRLFGTWADELEARGIHAISGRVIGDDDAFDDELWGSGWAWDDMDRSYAAGVGALLFNQNTAQLKLTPGTRAGESPAAAIEPPGSGLLLRNLTSTSAPEGVASVVVRRRLDSPTLEVRGTLPAAGMASVRNVAVHNPTTYFVTALRNALMAAGIDVQGGAVDIDEIADPPMRDRDTLLVSHRSAPLATIATTMMKLSQNLYAETLLKTVGRRGGVGSVETGRAAIVPVLQTWGIDASEIRMVDGSGLSRYDLLTVGAFTTILAHIARDARLRDAFEQTLPIAGRDGTLALRMNGTPADGNARAKTGAFSNARALSGYVSTADEERLAFSIIANNFGIPADLIEKTMDAIVVRRATFSRK